MIRINTWWRRRKPYQLFGHDNRVGGGEGRGVVNGYKRRSSDSEKIIAKR